MKPDSPIAAALKAHRSTLASVLAVILLANTFVVVARSLDGEGDERGSLVAEEADRGLDPTETTNNDPAVDGSQVAAPGTGTVTPSTLPSRDVRTAKPGTKIKGKGTVPFGINGNELTVVYYWKGDQTKSSPFLAGTGQEGNVDEGEAFRNLIAYINAHADDGEGSIMGFNFDLHGWRLKPMVIEAGKGDDQVRAAERIAEEIKPFAAVSSHGSVSAYVCPHLAKAGITNISTYDLDWGLYERTNGYCLPQGISFDAQVDLSVAYLAKDAKEHPERVYGFLYAEYPGLVDSAPKVVQKLRAAGVPIPEGAVQTVDPDLTTASRQQGGVILNFQQAGVNTIIAPESGSLITFTHAAEGAQYRPNYYVWPCSGQDSLGMTRLYDPNQWRTAAGLTCYDEWLNSDLTNNDLSRQTEWYAAYQEGWRVQGRNGSAEPPAPTALVYQSLLPLVAGITHAGKDLTIERFRAGMRAVKPYRYHAIEGRSSKPFNILVSISSPDGSQVGDAGKVYWDPNKRIPGNATPGAYAFPEDRRYRRGARF